MKVEMLRPKLYRENHCDVGMVVEMDGRTAAEFIELGWARPYAEPAPLTVEQADELVPTKLTRRKALR